MRALRLWQCSCLVLLGIFLAACQQPPRPHHHQSPPAQGYIQGQYRYIALEFAGVLREIYVQRGMHVTPGQPLFSLELESDSLNQAQIQLKQATQQQHHDETNLALARLAVKHREKLLQQNATTQDSVDEAQMAMDQAQAQVAKDKAATEEAKTALAQASVTKTQKMVMADVPALVANAYYLPGAFVPAKKPVVTLLAPQDIKVIFFVAETDLTSLALDQTVKITCQTCPPGLRGKIFSISHQAEFTPPMLYNNDTRKEVVYRIKAVLTSSLATRLQLNQRVMVMLENKST